jgi:hypothetical protein
MSPITEGEDDVITIGWMVTAPVGETEYGEVTSKHLPLATTYPRLLSTTVAYFEVGVVSTSC